MSEIELLTQRVTQLEELNANLTKENTTLQEELLRIKSEAFQFKTKKEKLELKVETLKEDKKKYKVQAERLESKWYNPWMTKVLNGMTMNIVIMDQVAFWRMKYFTKLGTSTKEIPRTARSDIMYDKIVEVIVFSLNIRSLQIKKKTSK